MNQNESRNMLLAQSRCLPGQATAQELSYAVTDQDRERWQST